MVNIFCLITLSLLFNSCISKKKLNVDDSTTTSSSTASISAPNLGAYQTPQAIYTKNSAITANTLSNTGGEITSCSSNPQLPAGLSLGTTSCAIPGTPTSVSATTDYTVTASNSAGSDNVTVNITINDMAPNLADSYATSPANYPENTAITANTITNSGGSISSCSITPDIPAGFSLSSTSCAISGTPTTITASQTYTITATNSIGSDNVSLTLAVTDATSPTVTVSNLLDKGTVISSLLIGLASDNVGVESVEVSIDSTTAYQSASGTTTWSYRLPTGSSTWRDGSSHTLRIRSKDAQGNYSDVTTLSVTKGAYSDINGDGYGDFVKSIWPLLLKVMIMVQTMDGPIYLTVAQH